MKKEKIRCHQCKFDFLESSVEFGKRKKSLPLCPACHRINKVEKSLKKREEEKELIFQATKLKKKFGQISPLLLARKFQINLDLAVEIFFKINQ